MLLLKLDVGLKVNVKMNVGKNNRLRICQAFRLYGVLLKDLRILPALDIV